MFYLPCCKVLKIIVVTVKTKTHSERTLLYRFRGITGDRKPDSKNRESVDRTAVLILSVVFARPLEPHLLPVAGPWWSRVSSNSETFCFRGTSAILTSVFLGSSYFTFVPSLNHRVLRISREVRINLECKNLNSKI